MRTYLRITETQLKGQIKDYLAYRGIYSFPITQGLGSYRGAPDRVIHYQGQVHYLEIKLPSGKMSDYQTAFQEQCRADNIHYHVIHSIEELEIILTEQLKEVKK